MTPAVTDSAAEPVTVTPPASTVTEPDAPREPGAIETMTRAFVDALPYPAGDPRQLMGEVAVALARRVDDDGAVPASVRELRTLFTQLVEVPSQGPGLVDEFRIRRAHRRLDGILAQADAYLAQVRAV